MRNKELERIAQVLAVCGEARTDGECLEEVWALLVSWGVNPDDYRTPCGAPECACAPTDELGRRLAWQQAAYSWEDAARELLGNADLGNAPAAYLRALRLTLAAERVTPEPTTAPEGDAATL